MNKIKFHFYGQMVNLTSLYKMADLNYYHPITPLEFLQNYHGDFISKTNINKDGDIFITKKAALDYAGEISLDLEVELYKQIRLNESN